MSLELQRKTKKHFSVRRFDVSCVFQAARLIVNNLNKLAYLLRFQNVCICLRLQKTTETMIIAEIIFSVGSAVNREFHCYVSHGF